MKMKKTKIISQIWSILKMFLRLIINKLLKPKSKNIIGRVLRHYWEEKKKRFKVLRWRKYKIGKRKKKKKKKRRGGFKRVKKKILVWSNEFREY